MDRARQIEVAYADTPESTSLSGLDEHEWSMLCGQWAKGIDWNVHKLGRGWVPAECYGRGWSMFRTKKAAYEAVGRLVLTESKVRARRRLLSEQA